MYPRRPTSCRRRRAAKPARGSAAKTLGGHGPATLRCPCLRATRLVVTAYDLQGSSPRPLTEIPMRKPTYVASLLVSLAMASCATAPVGSVVYRAWCETDARWLSKEWSLTAAEAQAHVELHRCQHPEHSAVLFSTAGPVPTDAADAPPNFHLPPNRPQQPASAPSGARG